MNYNEELKRNILIKLAENININFENQQIVERVLIELLFSTGCRLSEVVGINLEDLNYRELSIRVIGKGNKERIMLNLNISKV